MASDFETAEDWPEVIMVCRWCDRTTNDLAGHVTICPAAPTQRSA